MRVRSTKGAPAAAPEACCAVLDVPAAAGRGADCSTGRLEPAMQGKDTLAASTTCACHGAEQQPPFLNAAK